MKVNNKGGIGNPNHDDETGEFTSIENAGGQNGDDDELESLIFGSDGNDVLDSLVFGDNSLTVSNELDELFKNLTNNEKEETMLLSTQFEIPEDVAELDFEDTKELVGTFEWIDKDKIKSLNEDQLKQLISAQILIEEKTKKENSFLEQFNKKTFYQGELWLESVKPSDYEEKLKNGSYENKLSYFENFYQGANKEEKLALMAEFKELGEKYIKEKEKFESKYKAAEEYINQFYKSDYVYSQKRKDEAIWVKTDSVSESSKFFQDVADTVFSKLEKENPNALKSVEKYTSSYSFINEPLRNKIYYGESEKQEKFVQEVKNMTYAIDQSTYDKDIWLQRGTYHIVDPEKNININGFTSEKELQDLVGKTFKDQGFVSCGAAKGSGFSNKDVILNLYCPRGTKMLYVPEISHFENENEMIIQRGYSYKITKAVKHSGKIYIDVDVILGSDSGKYDTEKLKELQKSNFK